MNGRFIDAFCKISEDLVVTGSQNGTERIHYDDAMRQSIACEVNSMTMRMMKSTVRASKQDSPAEPISAQQCPTGLNAIGDCPARGRTLRQFSRALLAIGGHTWTQNASVLAGPLNNSPGIQADKATGPVPNRAEEIPERTFCISLAKFPEGLGIKGPKYECAGYKAEIATELHTQYWTVKSIWYKKELVTFMLYYWNTSRNFPDEYNQTFFPLTYGKICWQLQNM